MLTLYHAPQSRSSRIVGMLYEMNIIDKVDICIVDIRRNDGSGGHDPANPHAEGKVPLLVHDGVEIRETNAIMLYLTELFPDSGLGVPVGDPQRGAFLSWLFWYGNVLEPVIIHGYTGLEHPALQATFRGTPEAVAVLTKGLDGREFLIGDRFTVVDMICSSPYIWFPDITPDVPAIKAWIERCRQRPAARQVAEFDRQAMAA